MISQIEPKNLQNPSRKNLSLLLHDIRSVHNVGSIFRTADGCGIKKIYLSGYTPAPTDRFGRTRSDIAKVALGAEKSVAWERVCGAEAETMGCAENVCDFIKKMKKDGVRVVALEQDERSIDYKKIKKVENEKVGDILLILGNEVDGINKEILKLADIVMEIPMRGEKESLNVSVAAGIAMYELTA